MHCYAHMLNQINSGSTISPIMRPLKLKQELQVVQMLVLMDVAFRYTDGDVNSYTRWRYYNYRLLF